MVRVRGPWYDTIYVVSRTWDPHLLAEGSIVFWDDHGPRDTIILFDEETRQTMPLAEITRVHRMTVEEMECLYGDPDATLCDCIPGIRGRLAEALTGVVENVEERLREICRGEP